MAQKALKSALGEQLRAIRLTRGLTQEQLAEQLSVTPRYLAGIERGERNLTLDSIDVLANELDVEVQLVLGRS
ncbi:helix-turn-helix domain-containing protein [Microbacterium resistens]|uniref:helix-turn-helix domain-containing protein n=1 Tax=Microbacterium resistens TaxID=156977 RepID=UPI000A06B640|nr:helix-turn-helix transcriptional regulator [Microbacterium resistens]